MRSFEEIFAIATERKATAARLRDYVRENTSPTPKSEALDAEVPKT